MSKLLAILSFLFLLLLIVDSLAPISIPFQFWQQPNDRNRLKTTKYGNVKVGQKLQQLRMEWMDDTSENGLNYDDDEDEDGQDDNDELGPGREQDYTYKSICLIGGRPAVVDNLDCRDQVVLGRFKNAINLTGWSYLEVESRPQFEPELQAYAAGFVEGLLTKSLLRMHIMNTVDDYCVGFQGFCDRMKEFIRENVEYTKGKLQTASPNDPYWQSVKRTYLQMTGLWHAYSGSPFNLSIEFDVHPIMMLQWKSGDNYDLETKLNKTKDPVEEDGIVGGKCSGLVKVAPDNQDLFISQVTMSGFQNLLRVLKLYKFGYDPLLFPGHTSTFSGYPGVLYSSDDFALTSTELAVIETTVKVWNTSLYEQTKAQGQLPCWVRAISANLLARSGWEWCQVFKRYNSGTYNNQWVVLDYKKFQPGRELPRNGVIYVLEQMPGHVYYQDMTGYLKQFGYFPSYNIPFFKAASDISGFHQKGIEFYWFNWTNCPRAKIFSRDHKKVVDLDSLTRLMRYNDYKNEEYSRCNCTPPYTAEAAISARGDLNDPNGTYPLAGMGHVNHAALDYKGTNYKLAKQMRFRAWSGPTYDNVPSFNWQTSDLAKTVKHIGHPDKWEFKPVEYRWETELK